MKKKKRERERKGRSKNGGVGVETGLVCALPWVEVELQKGDQQPLLKTEDYGL